MNQQLDPKRLSHELNTALAALKAGVRRLDPSLPGADLCRQGTERIEEILRDLNHRIIGENTEFRSREGEL